jgi:intergrase/recombinase
MNPRENHVSAELIDASINILREQGMYAATRMLCEAGVAMETACRVLRQPGQRRLYDNCVIHTWSLAEYPGPSARYAALQRQPSSFTYRYRLRASILLR